MWFLCDWQSNQVVSYSVFLKWLCSSILCPCCYQTVTMHSGWIWLRLFISCHFLSDHKQGVGCLPSPHVTPVWCDIPKTPTTSSNSCRIRKREAEVYLWCMFSVAVFYCSLNISASWPFTVWLWRLTAYLWGAATMHWLSICLHI